MDKHKPKKVDVWRTGDIKRIAFCLTKGGEDSIEISFILNDGWTSAWLTLDKVKPEVWNGWCKVLGVSGMEAAKDALASRKSFTFIGLRVRLGCVEGMYNGKKTLKVQEVAVFGEASPQPAAATQPQQSEEGEDGFHW